MKGYSSAKKTAHSSLVSFLASFSVSKKTKLPNMDRNSKQPYAWCDPFLASVTTFVWLLLDFNLQVCTQQKSIRSVSPKIHTHVPSERRICAESDLNYILAGSGGDGERQKKSLGSCHVTTALMSALGWLSEVLLSVLFLSTEEYTGDPATGDRDRVDVKIGGGRARFGPLDDARVRIHWTATARGPFFIPGLPDIDVPSQPLLPPDV